MNQKISPDGEIIKQDGIFVVRFQGNEPQGAHDYVCENPEAPAELRIYRKELRHKRIYLPDEVKRARQEVLGGLDVIVLGATGYSSITIDQQKSWGIKPGAYESACMDIIGTTVWELHDTFPGVQIKVAHGASDMGVDRAVIKVARTLNLEHLGHSCPKFLFYVADDDDPVYVARSQAEYADAFVVSLDILLAMNGRMQALKHDIAAAIELQKHLILLNVIKAISDRGGPPARNADGGVEDATAAFEQAISVFSSLSPAEDYTALKQRAVATSINYCRRTLSPTRAYSSWARR